jgi:cytochrome c6
MKKSFILPVIAVAASLIGTLAFAEKPAPKNEGETKFKEHCAVCHPDGGNIVNPKKALHKKDRDANGVKSEADIVKTIRKPGPGMTPFDAKTLSDKDAGEIAKYIVKTFK